MGDKPEQFLYLTSIGWKSGRSHEIEIWFTALEGRYYVIAERGERSHWVQNIQRQPAVSLRVGEARFSVTARVVDSVAEGALQARVSALSRAKYGWGEGLIIELKEVSERTTDPAGPS